MFTRVRHLCLSQARLIIPRHPFLFNSHFNIFRMVYFLQGLQLKQQDVPHKSIPNQNPLLSIRRTCPAHFVVLGLITQTVSGYLSRRFTGLLQIFFCM